MINLKQVKRYCKDFEKIENYDKAIADTTQTWDCHHRAEICYSRKELIEKGDYYNVPACNLIFLTSSEHSKLHTTERYCSEETKRKISESLKGNQWNKGKHHSEESKRKMSKVYKGKHWKLVDGKRVWY